MIPADFDYRTIAPDSPLGRFVEQVFYARGRIDYRRERILPAPGAVLLVILGPPLLMTEPRAGASPGRRAGACLSGPHERPILNEPTGETHVVGVVFRPGGMAAFMDEPVHGITNRILPLEEAGTTLGPASDLVAALENQKPDRSMEILAERLCAGISVPHDHRRWQEAIEALTRDASVASVQDSLGVSRRHFSSQIRKRSGLLPRSLKRIARMRGLLEELDARKPIRWSMEAVGAGYFDQPHAIRDFKEFTGMTPGEYVERRRRVWGHAIEPGEAANFVPELIR